MRDPEVGVPGGAFEPYPRTPDPVPIVVDDEVIVKVAATLSGGGALSGTDAIDLKGWLINYGVESATLREEMGSWTMWLANGSPPGRLSER